MKYHYTGLTRQREKVSGTIEAVDEIEAKMRLRGMQIRPHTLFPETGKMFEVPSIFKRSAIDLKGMMVFTRQFSSLIDSGVAVVQCLGILQQQERRPRFKKILLQVKEDIEAGGGLAESLGKHPETFPEYFVRLIEAGEISGTLDRSLRRVGTQMEKLGRLRAKVFTALLYPAITVLVAVFVLVFLLVKVIPEIAKLYGGQKLPELTQTVLDMSEWFQTNYLYVIGGIAFLVFGFIALYRIEKFREVFDKYWLKLPLFGPLAVKSSVAKFTRTMSTLISCGVPLLNGFDICEKILSNREIRTAIREAANAVSEGKGIAVGLAAANVFPPMVLHMISIGEMTGRLDELMAKVADIYDDEVDDAVNNMTGLIQPALIVVVGLMIAFLMLAMYAPIFNLGEKAAGE